MVCPALFFTLTTIWVLGSPTNILERDPRCFTFMVGIVFSNICCQLIVAQMSNTRCEVFSWLLVPVGAVVAAALILPSSLHLELPLLYMLTAFTFLAHVHYGVCLVSTSSALFIRYRSKPSHCHLLEQVRQMCRHLNIWCFRLKPRKED